MYIDVHWSFILLFSQVIFSFKEPYVHYIALKKMFWKRKTTESYELSLECCWKDDPTQNGSLWTQQLQTFSQKKKIVKPSTWWKNNFVNTFK